MSSGTAWAEVGPLSGVDFPMSIHHRYFEDYRDGATYEYGYVSVSEESILRFGREFDPQPMHVDPAFAASGPFGGLIASGWHTAAIFTRLFVDHYLSRVASLASPGMDELRWPTPLRPGDSVKAVCTVLETRSSKSKPDRGLVRSRGELVTSEGRPVFQVLALNFLARRDVPALSDTTDSDTSDGSDS